MASLPPNWCGTNPTRDTKTTSEERSNEDMIPSDMYETVTQTFVTKKQEVPRQPPETTQELFGDEDLVIVEPTGSVELPDPKLDDAPVLQSSPSCATQKSVPTPTNRIYIGWGKEIPRWKPGCAIRWTTIGNRFRTPEEARWASASMERAAATWNKYKIGVVFSWVSKVEDALFALTYGGADSDPNTLAEAFFPNPRNYCHRLQYVYVYQAAFDGGWKDYMWAVFVHELGHVLGLRHEFAMDEGPDGLGAVQMGQRNEMSVMNYRSTPPALQQSDIRSAKAFYGAKPSDPYSKLHIGGVPVVDYY